MPVNGTRTALKVKAAIFIIFWCWCCYCCYYFEGGVTVFVGGVGVVVVVVVVALFVSLMRSRLDLYLTRFWAQKNLFTTGIRSVQQLLSKPVLSSVFRLYFFIFTHFKFSLQLNFLEPVHFNRLQQKKALAPRLCSLERHFCSDTISVQKSQRFFYKTKFKIVKNDLFNIFC